MRTPWIAGIAVVAAGVVAQAAITPEQTARLKNATAVVNAMRQAGTSPQIPEDVWNRANCVLVLPSVKKAAFIFGGEYGKGVVSCRRDKAWSPPAFMELEKGSWGFQAGAEEVDLVLLMMNAEGMQKLLQDKVTLGAGASIAAGPVGRTARAETDAQMHAEILSYSRSNGVFAGVNLAGGVLHPDEEANRDVYGAAVDIRSLLNGGSKAATPPAAAGFLTALQAGTVGTSGR